MSGTIWKGLSARALDLVKGEKKAIGEKIEITTFYDERPPEKTEPVTVFESTVIRLVNGRYPIGGIEYDMHEYLMPDGRLLSEIIQKVARAKGLVFVFAALEDVVQEKCVKESLWDDLEMEKAIKGIDSCHEAEMAAAGYSPS